MVKLIYRYGFQVGLILVALPSVWDLFRTGFYSFFNWVIYPLGILCIYAGVATLVAYAVAEAMLIQELKRRMK